MIIDSHAHCNSSAFKNTFRYLTRNEDGYALREGDREQLFQELLDANIRLFQLGEHYGMV